MADAVTFASCLERIGFNEETRDFLGDQGIASMEDLRNLPLSEFNRMIKHFSRTTTQGGDITFPYIAVRKLKALCSWADYRFARGQDMPAASFRDGVIVRFLDRITVLDEIKLSQDEDELKTPPELKSMADWPTFEELLLLWIAQHCSPMNGTPLTYVTHP